MKKYLAGVFVVFLISTLNAKTIRIPSDYPTIQQGIDSANSGDMVLVARGTYTGDINMKSGIYLKSEEGPESTIIERVCCYNLTDTVVIDGFTIDNGYFQVFWGGGIYSRNSNLIIKNNIIRDNYITNPACQPVAGAGIYVKEGSALIENNIIRNNTADGDYVMKNKTQCGNAGGGGIYAEFAAVTIKNNVIKRNSVIVGSWYGGGIACLECIKAVIFNNLIDSNFCDPLWGGGRGDAIYCTGPAIIINNTLAKNGRTDTTHHRCIGGIYCDEASTGQDSIIIRNNIFAFDSAETAGAIYCLDSLDLSKVFISYNDFYQNAGGDFYNPPAGVGNFSWGTNRNGNPCDSFYNININPGFTTGPLGTYYQQNVSGCGDYIVNDEFKGQGGNTIDGTPDTGWVDLGYHYGVLAGIEENSKVKTQISKLKIIGNKILLSLPNAANAELKLFDLAGREREVLYSGILTKGNYTFTPKTRARGVYFVRMETGDYKETGKLILLK